MLGNSGIGPGQLGMLGCKRTAAVTTKNYFLAVTKHLAKQLEEVRAHYGLQLSIAMRI